MSVLEYKMVELSGLLYCTESLSCITLSDLAPKALVSQIYIIFSRSLTLCGPLSLSLSLFTFSLSLIIHTGTHKYHSQICPAIIFRLPQTLLFKSLSLYAHKYCVIMHHYRLSLYTYPHPSLPTPL